MLWQLAAACELMDDFTTPVLTALERGWSTRCDNVAVAVDGDFVY